MSHSHDHAPSNFGRTFAIGVGLNVLYVIVELIYGSLSGSLALLADAGHNASDVLGLLLAWGAHRLANVKPTRRYTYGLKRSSILASLANAVLLLVAIGAIIWEAVRRLLSPEAVGSGTIIWVAAIGVVVNAITAFLLSKGQQGDLNVRGAFIHMAADTGVSVGVVVAGVLIALTGWPWIDPAISLAVAAVILWSTWGLLRDSVNLSLDAVPEDVDLNKVRGYLASLPGVSSVHDLHIWAMSTTETALSAHLVMAGAALDGDFYSQIQRELSSEYDIHHATLQVEQRDQACDLAPGSQKADQPGGDGARLGP